MFVTKRALPRRTFLRGVGTTMALPLRSLSFFQYAASSIRQGSRLPASVTSAIWGTGYSIFRPG